MFMLYVSYNRKFTLFIFFPSIYFSFGYWELIRPTWGLMVEMAHYGSQTKNKITVTLETDQIVQMASCYLTGAYLLKAVRPPDSRPPAM